MLGGSPRKYASSVLAAVVVVTAACLEKTRTPVVYEIPSGYVGWVRIDFEQPDAPALPVRSGERIIRIPTSGMLRTSSPFETGVAKDEYVAYSSRGESQLP